MQNDKQEIVQRDAATQPAKDTPAIMPAVDIWETEAGIDLCADVPGVSREGLNIRVDGETLTIEGAIALGEPENMEPVRAEIREPLFRRSFTLSRELDTTAIRAAVRNGVLRLHIPRQEEAKPRKIEVQID